MIMPNLQCVAQLLTQQNAKSDTGYPGGMKPTGYAYKAHGDDIQLGRASNQSLALCRYVNR